MPVSFMIKLVGSFFLLLTGGYVSVTVSRFEHRRLQVLDGYIALIYYIKGQIDCYALPIAEILARVDPAVLSACLGQPSGKQMVAPPIRISPSEPPLSALVRESRLYLEPECDRLLSAFAGEFGQTFRADQVSRCDHYIGELSEHRRRLVDALPARTRVSSTLCLATAAAMVVLLW